VEPEDVLSPEAARNHALAADRHLGSEILYLEYSGTYGGEEATEILDALSDNMTYARIWYGGGLGSRDHVEEILDAGATTAVVGDVFHDIATEEADLCADAADELEADPATETVREWVEEAVDIETTSAVSFLETIPSVADPPALATRYLTATVETYLALSSLLAESDADLETCEDVADLVASAPDDALPADSPLVDALADDRRTAVTEYWASVLASVAGQPELASLPARHLAASR
jgi:phosphoglycerol geranylgeranyltransferase